MLEYDVSPLILEGPTSGPPNVQTMRGLQFGGGENVIKANEQGFFIGAGDFASAPFRVDYDGNLYASSATFPSLVTIYVFKQTSIPTSTAVGDLWFDTDDNNKIYRAASVGADAITAGEWELLNDLRAADALLQAGGQTLTGAINVFNTSVKIDGANRRIVINDGTNDRVLIGYLPGKF